MPSFKSVWAVSAPLVLLSLAAAANGASAPDVRDKDQDVSPMTPQLLARLYAIAAGELAKDPAGSAKRLRAAVENFHGVDGRVGYAAFNTELSPACGAVFTGLLSTVLALVGGVSIPEYLEFIKWLDSVAKPEAGILHGNARWIGSREECESLRLPVYADPNNASSVMFRTSGRYCTFKLNSTKAGNGTLGDAAFSGGDLGAQLQANLQLALCLPNPCQGKDAEIAVNYVIQFILGFLLPLLQGIPGLGGILASLKSFSLLVDGCSVTSQEVAGHLSTGAIVMIALTVFLVILILAATVVNAVMEYNESCRNGTFRKICRAFCLRTNLTKLFAPPAADDQLACLNGIRVFSIFWVILGHSLLVIATMLDNPLQLLNDFRKRWQSVLIINATTSVDSFFLLSGALVAYGFFQKIRPQEPESSKKLLRSAKFWLLYYFHRYWRLTPPLMFFVFWQVYLLKYFGDGAFLPKDRAMLDTENCRKNWWTLATYVQNFVGVAESCMGHTWYLANDMQMYLISPLMLLPFYYGGIKLGSAIAVTVVAISMICTGVINSNFGFKKGHLNFIPGEQDGYNPKDSYYDIVYIKPYCRIGAYAIGIILGYILATKKTLKLHPLIVIAGWLGAVAGGLTLLYLVQPQIAGTGEPLTVPQVSTFWSFLRPGFALCVAWAAFACAYGYGGPVNFLLSFSWFAPLARLTYCAYIVHICVMYMFYVTYDAKYHLSDSLLIMVFLFNLMASFLASLVLSMLVEAPLLGLEKALLTLNERPQVEPLEQPQPQPHSQKLSDEVSSSRSFASRDFEMSEKPAAESAADSKANLGDENEPYTVL